MVIRSSGVGEGNLPGESLRQLAQAIQRVQVWALPVASKRLAVQLDAVYRLQAGHVQVSDGERGGVKHNQTQSVFLFGVPDVCLLSPWSTWSILR